MADYLFFIVKTTAAAAATITREAARAASEVAGLPPASLPVPGMISYQSKLTLVPANFVSAL